jgi:hypothetical protein
MHPPVSVAWFNTLALLLLVDQRGISKSGSGTGAIASGAWVIKVEKIVIATVIGIAQRSILSGMHTCCFG